MIFDILSIVALVVVLMIVAQITGGIVHGPEDGSLKNIKDGVVVIFLAFFAFAALASLLVLSINGVALIYEFLF